MDSPTRRKRQFASDNYAPVCPEAWAAMAEANRGHAPSYGDDPWTTRAREAFQKTFDADCAVYFVCNGTAANALALATLCRPHHAVICHEAAHIQTDECGATEFFSGGAKLLTVPGFAGKLDLEAVRRRMLEGHGIHTSRPAVLSITQPTELGALYSLGELRAVQRLARQLGLRVHMDGARFANAVAALRCAPKDIIRAAGVDILSLGGTKNGLLGADLILFFDMALAEEFDYRRKQAGQLVSKMRFMAAQWLGVLKDRAWLRHATHANAMAAALEVACRPLHGMKVLYPRQSNAVFVRLPRPVATALFRRGWRFYNFLGPDDYRLMCAWDTQADDVAEFARDLIREARG